MRSTSIKSIVAAVSIATTLTLAVPAVAANRSPRDSRVNREGVIHVVVKAFKRIADFTTNILPSTPPGTPGNTTSGSGTGTGTGG